MDLFRTEVNTNTLTFPGISSCSVAGYRYVCFKSGPAVKNVARRRVATTMLAPLYPRET